MTFETRSAGAAAMSTILDEYFESIGYEIQPFGYEDLFPADLKAKLRKIHNNPTVQYVRYVPDRFVFHEKWPIFLMEYKICNAPITRDSRVATLQKISGDKKLSKANIAVIETAALDVYQGLASLGLNILVVVYSSFHTRGGIAVPLIASAPNKIVIKHRGKVALGEGNASWTPYSNVNLDEFMPLDETLVKLGIPEAIVKKEYGDVLKKLSEALSKKEIKSEESLEDEE